MNKIIALVSIAVLALCIAGCDGQKEAKKKEQAEVEKVFKTGILPDQNSTGQKPQPPAAPNTQATGGGQPPVNNTPTDQ